MAKLGSNNADPLLHSAHILPVYTTHIKHCAKLLLFCQFDIYFKIYTYFNYLIMKEAEQ